MFLPKKEKMNKKLILILPMLLFILTGFASKEEAPAFGDAETLSKQTVSSSKNVPFQLDVHLPEEFKYTPNAPVGLQVFSADGKKLLKEDIKNPSKSFPKTYKLNLGSETLTDLRITLNLYYCEAKDARICYFKTVKLIQPVEVSPASQTQAITISYDL